MGSCTSSAAATRSSSVDDLYDGATDNEVAVEDAGLGYHHHHHHHGASAAPPALPHVSLATTSAAARPSPHTFTYNTPFATIPHHRQQPQQPAAAVYGSDDSSGSASRRTSGDSMSTTASIPQKRVARCSWSKTSSELSTEQPHDEQQHAINTASADGGNVAELAAANMSKYHKLLAWERSEKKKRIGTATNNLDELDGNRQDVNALSSLPASMRQPNTRHANQKSTWKRTMARMFNSINRAREANKKEQQPAASLLEASARRVAMHQQRQHQLDTTNAVNIVDHATDEQMLENGGHPTSNFRHVNKVDQMAVNDAPSINRDTAITATTLISPPEAPSKLAMAYRIAFQDIADGQFELSVETRELFAEAAQYIAPDGTRCVGRDAIMQQLNTGLQELLGRFSSMIPGGGNKPGKYLMDAVKYDVSGPVHENNGSWSMTYSFSLMIMSYKLKDEFVLDDNGSISKMVRVKL